MKRRDRTDRKGPSYSLRHISRRSRVGWLVGGIRGGVFFYVVLIFTQSLRSKTMNGDYPRETKVDGKSLSPITCHTYEIECFFLP